MSYTQILPFTLVLINIGAATVYALDQDWNRCIYWLSAATLTTCVTLR